MVQFFRVTQNFQKSENRAQPKIFKKRENRDEPKIFKKSENRTTQNFQKKRQKENLQNRASARLNKISFFRTFIFFGLIFESITIFQAKKLISQSGVSDACDPQVIHLLFRSLIATYSRGKTTPFEISSTFHIHYLSTRRWHPGICNVGAVQFS